MDTLTIKLASIAVHAEELLDMQLKGVAGEQAANFDRAAIRGVLADPEVRAWLDDPAHAVLLPSKRSTDKDNGS